MEDSVSNNNKINKMLFMQPLSPIIPHNNSTVIFKADSGASKHYLRDSDAAILTNLENIVTPRRVILPNNESIKITKQGTLPLSDNITMDGRKASVLPGLKNASLLSLGQLCDNDCKIILQKENMTVYKNNTIILTGLRNKRDGLWDVQLNKKLSSSK